ncbi:MAG: tRNA1(Val) (adenine(37)-N6)-methyltransferase [Acetivibrionales bacterium]
MHIQDNERIDDLQFKGLKLIQKKDAFCFGIDAVLLANFADVRKDSRVIDLGTGTGIIAILLAAKTGAKEVVGLEIQDEMCEMALRSVKLNNLEDRVKIVNGNIKECVEYFGSSQFDVVVSNPPYMAHGRGLVNPSDTKAVSRHEILCTLEDVVQVASRLLITSGQFAMVHRPERIADVLCLMRKYSIEPKYLRFVHPSPYKKANLILVKGIKNARPYLKIMEPLYVYDMNGEYSDEINRIYNRTIGGGKII